MCMLQHTTIARTTNPGRSVMPTPCFVVHRPGQVDSNVFNSGPKRAYFDYVRVYNWPSSRRLDGSPEIAEDWRAPEGDYTDLGC